jgi:hypothetical protein
MTPMFLYNDVIQPAESKKLEENRAECDTFYETFTVLESVRALRKLDQDLKVSEPDVLHDI